MVIPKRFINRLHGRYTTLESFCKKLERYIRINLFYKIMQLLQNRSVSLNHAISHFTMTRSLLAGAALAWAIKKENYIHIPLILFVPSMYTGYHVYENKDELIAYVKSQLK